MIRYRIKVLVRYVSLGSLRFPEHNSLYALIKHIPLQVSHALLTKAPDEAVLQRRQVLMTCWQPTRHTGITFLNNLLAHPKRAHCLKLSYILSMVSEQRSDI